MIQFKLLSKAFDLFYHQYSHIKEHANLTESSPLFLFAKSFSDEWLQFIRYYMVIADNGTAPQITEINSSFDSLYNSLCDLRTLMTDEKFKTDVGCKAILSVQKSIHSIRKEIQRLFIKTENPISEFDEESFNSKMKDLSGKISVLFMRSLTHQCLKRGDKNRINANMNAACCALKENVIAAMSIPQAEFQTRQAITNLNSLITQEFMKLKIPYTIDIDFENNFTDDSDG